MTRGALQIQDRKTGLVNTYSVSAGPVQFNATSRFHKHKNIADYQLNMLLSVLMNEIDSSLDTGQQLIHNTSRK